MSLLYHLLILFEFTPSRVTGLFLKINWSNVDWVLMMKRVTYTPSRLKLVLTIIKVHTWINYSCNSKRNALFQRLPFISSTKSCSPRSFHEKDNQVTCYLCYIHLISVRVNFILPIWLLFFSVSMTKMWVLHYIVSSHNQCMHTRTSVSCTTW